MRKMTFVVVAIITILSILSIPQAREIQAKTSKHQFKINRLDDAEKTFGPHGVRSGSTPIFSKIQAKINVTVQEQKYGVMDCDVSSTFTVDEDYEIEKRWLNVVWLLKVNEVTIDNVPIKFHFYDYEGNVLDFLQDRKLKPGTHVFRAKYQYKMDIPPSYYEAVDLWTYCGVDGFHLFNNWYFVPRNDFDFSDVVDFDMDISVPPNWFLCGSYVPEEFRDKPCPTGRYKFVSRTDAPFGYRILGGDYEVMKTTVNESNVRVYHFKDSKGDGPYILDYAADCLKFFGEYYDHKSKGDYFVAQIRCTPGSGFGCEGGFSIDAPFLTKEYFFPEFLAHEMAHVSWWGGDGVAGSRDQPHYRFMSEAFAEFSSFLFCEKRVSYGYYWLVIMQEEAYYWKYCQGGSPLSSPASANSFPLTYYKGGLVINCLKSWMGEDAFQAGMREMVATYALKDGQNPDDRPRCTQQDYKKIMEKAFGASLDDFWSVYFDSSSVPIPNIDISKLKGDDGSVKEKLTFKFKGNDKLPIKVRVYYVDGTSEDFTNPGGENSFDLTKQSAGLENLNWRSLIHEKTTTYHTMGSSTVAAIIKWRKPTIVCLDDDYHDRAKRWANITGSDVETSAPVPFQPASIILVGPKAINTFAPKVIPNLPAKPTGDLFLEWYTLKISGDFAMTACSPNPDNYNSAIICDLDTGSLPEDLSWTAYFKRVDDCFDVAYRSMANGALVPPKPEFQNIPWVELDSTVYDCRLSMTFDKPKNYRINYQGFDEKSFTIGKVDKSLDDLGQNAKIILDLSKGSCPVTIYKNTRNLIENWHQNQIYGGKGKYIPKPDGLLLNTCSGNTDYTAKWNENLSYLYQLDGNNSETWESGNSLLLQNLAKDNHDLKIVFINNGGLLSEVQSVKFASGVPAPKLELSDSPALWKGGKVIVIGFTDPDATLDPPAKINPDGTFTIEQTLDKAPTSIKVTATNSCGFTTSRNTAVIKYVKFFLTLGSMVAKDYEGNVYPLQAAAQSVKGSTYVPMRFIGERLGAQIDWNGKEKKVTYVLGRNTVEIWISKKTAKINGEDVEMPGAPVIVSGTTLVPLRFVGNALGAGISWDIDTKTATVEYPAP